MLCQAMRSRGRCSRSQCFEVILLKWVFPETHTSGFRKEHAHDISGFSRKKVAQTVQRRKKGARCAFSRSKNKGYKSASKTQREIKRRNFL